MPETARAWHLECVDAHSRHNKFYRALIVEDTPVYQYGLRGTPGQTVIRRQFRDYRAWDDVNEHLVAKQRNRGYRMVSDMTYLTLPTGTDVDTPDLGALLTDAFAVAWAAKWAPALRELSTLTSAPPSTDGLQLAILPRWCALRRTWPGQETTQPWGPALAAVLAGAPRADLTLRDLSAVVVPSCLLPWLNRYYSQDATSGSLASTPAASGDNAQVLTAMLALWQPAARSPLADLGAALAAARSITS